MMDAVYRGMWQAKVDRALADIATLDLSFLPPGDQEKFLLVVNAAREMLGHRQICLHGFVDWDTCPQCCH